MTNRKRRLRNAPKRAALAVSLGAIGLSAMAQVSDSGEDPSRLVLSFGGKLGDASEMFTTADLRVVRQTRTQELTFGATGGITLDADRDFAAGLKDPQLQLSYRHQGGPASLSASITFQRSDVDGVVSTDELNNGLSQSDFVDDQGTRADTTGRVALTFGERARFGATIGVQASQTRYTDTTDPDFFDSDSWAADLAFRLDVSDVLQLSPVFTYSETDRADDLNTIQSTQTARLSATYALNPVTSLTAGLSWSEITTSEDAPGGDRNTDVDEGAGLQLGGRITQKDGFIGLNYNRSLDASGTVQSLTFEQSREISKTQRLSYSFGVAQFDDTEQVIGSLNFTQALSNGQVSARLSQTIGVTEDDTRAINRSLQAGYETALTARGDLFANAEYAYLDDTAPEAATYESLSVSVGYRHALTSDWSASATISHRMVWEDETETDNSSDLSLSLSRNISLFR